MTETASAPSALAEGKQLGRYRLEYLLGAGGMGAVWAAHDEDLDRHVALKVLNADLAGDEVAQARLQREAMAMAKLRHPNVITVFDVTVIEEHCLIAMELVEGQTMASWLTAEARDPEAVFDTLLAAGRGLVAAHAAGMIHRDFKPHNVLVEPGGRVLVTDFGLARRTGDVPDRPLPPRPSAPVLRDAEATRDGNASTPGPQATVRERPSRPSGDLAKISDSAIAKDDTMLSPPDPDLDRVAFATPLTRTGTVLGTPAYMAPEQFRGELADARADQFAFCVTAWEALAGKRPFAGSTYDDLARDVDSGKPAHEERVPRRIRAVLLRGLAREPEARWPSMAELLAAMEQAWRGKSGRRRSLILIGGLFVLVFAITLVVSTLTKRRSADPPSVAPVICPTGRDALAGTWGPAEREKLGRLANNPVSAMGFVDRWATAWSNTYDANCRHPEDVDFAARRICLEAQRDDLGVMFGDMTAAAKGIQRAELGRVMPSPVACQRQPRAIAPPLPADPTARKRISELRIALHVLKTDTYLGDGSYADLVQRGDQFVEQALATGYPPVHAEALFNRALVRQVKAPETGEDRAVAIREAFKWFNEAANAAEAASYDRIRVDALLGALECALELKTDADLDDLVRRTEVAVTRLGDPSPELSLETLRSLIALHRGRWSEAVTRSERARLGWQERGATDTMARAAMIEAQARHLRHASDDLDRALAAITAGLAGEPRQSWKLTLLRERGMIEWRRGHRAEARIALIAAKAPQPILEDGAGSSNGGRLNGAVTGLNPGTTLEDESDVARATRRALPFVSIRSDIRSWTVPVETDGTWSLDNVPRGPYTVGISTISARGDVQIWRTTATVLAGQITEVPVQLPTPSLQVAADAGPAERLHLVYGGSTVVTAVGKLREQLAAAPWVSATAAREVTAFGEPFITCDIPGAHVEHDQIVIPDAAEPKCSLTSPPQ